MLNKRGGAMASGPDLPIRGFADSARSIDLNGIAEATFLKTAEVGLKHARANRRYVRQTIAELSDGPWRGRPAIVVSAGPSLHRQQIAEQIRKSGFAGTIVATDGALGYCLRNGVVPDFVVSVDPHPTRIVRWFGDTELHRRPPDGYFRRQDLDPHLMEKERQRNRELIALTDQYASRVRAILSTSVAPSVTRRVRQSGMPMYWWNPIYDNYDAPVSHTRRIYELTKAPCLVTGGNCGTVAWVFAGAVLGATDVAVTGMDLSYPPDTPLQHTQYYPEMKKLFGDRAEDYYIRLKNPHLAECWYTDPTYWWYRESFLALAQKARFKTYNCTGGGILFGPRVRWTSLSRFLQKRSG